MAAIVARDTGREVRSVSLRPSRYRTSFPVHDVELTFADGETSALVLKELGRDTLSDDARAAKPAFLHDPRREPWVYRDLLPRLALDAVALVAAEEDPATQRNWLLIERIEGCELYQVGEIEQWRSVAEWFALLHRRSASWVRQSDVQLAPLLRHGRAWLDLWSERAAGNLDDVSERRRLAAATVAATRILAAWPASLVHGEAYASNVLVGGRDGRVRICPVDWEMAAIGVGLCDLAALTAGNWEPDQRAAIEEAYLAALGPERESADTFGLTLTAARFQMAVQWLGWSSHWQPPSEHAQDWRSEALALAEELLG